MAILTSKGARAPHQLKGRRNVRISRDRRGCGNDDIKGEIDNALANYQIGDISKASVYDGDVNNLTFGIYRCALSCTNLPEPITGIMECIYRGSTTRTQIYTTDRNKKYIRVDSSNGWLSWEKLTTEKDLLNYGEVLTFVKDTSLTADSTTVKAIRIGKIVTVSMDLRSISIGTETNIGSITLDSSSPIPTDYTIERDIIYMENNGVRTPLPCLVQFSTSSTKKLTIKIQSNNNNSSLGTIPYIFGTVQFILV